MEKTYKGPSLKSATVKGRKEQSQYRTSMTQEKSGKYKSKRLISTGKGGQEEVELWKKGKGSQKKKEGKTKELKARTSLRGKRETKKQTKQEGKEERVEKVEEAVQEVRKVICRGGEECPLPSAEGGRSKNQRNGD